MRMLITGGAGFIGSNFLRQIIEGNDFKPNEIIVLDLLTYSGTKSNFDGIDVSQFEFIHGDIRNEILIESILKRVDVIVHFAAESHVDRSIESARIFMDTNVVGTEVLLECAIRKEVETFIHVSTDEVYGSITTGSWTEDFPLNPNSPYAASKASSDLVALSFFRTYGLDVRVTRCSNNYGPNQYPEKIIPLFITNLLQGKSVPLYGNGANIRDWLHVRDHCRAINLVLKNGKAGEIYNIGGGKELSNLDLTKILLREFGLGEELIQKVPDRKGHDFRYSLNYEKSARQLGYQPQISFEKGIQSTIAWYESNENWWRQLVS